MLPSPNQPRPAGVDQIGICRKRASPQPAGEGSGVGVAVGGRISLNNDDPPPQPSPTRGEGADRLCRLNCIPLQRAAARAQCARLLAKRKTREAQYRCNCLALAQARLAGTRPSPNAIFDDAESIQDSRNFARKIRLPRRGSQSAARFVSGLDHDGRFVETHAVAVEGQRHQSSAEHNGKAAANCQQQPYPGRNAGNDPDP